MSLKISGEREYEIHPAGAVAARCIRLVELGTQESEYLGQSKKAKKVMLAFETTALITEGEFSGQPFLMTTRYTASLHEKAALRKILKGWRGRDFNDTELEGFDLKNVLGKNCLMNVVHNTANGKTYANIDSVMPLPAGMTAPKVNPLVHFDLDDFNQEVFDSLSKGLQEVIAKSPEYKRLQYGEAETASGAAAPSMPDLDDDIPFATNSPYFDQTTSKARRMAKYSY